MTDIATGIAFQCTDIHKRYGDVVAVNGLRSTVTRGECFGLLGPNGAGKTTTIEILEGLLAPDAGEVEVLGLRWGATSAQLRQRLGIPLQETRLAEKLTVRETLRLFRSFYHARPDVDELLAAWWRSRASGRSWVGKLSGGQKQRLAVACALVGDPDCCSSTSRPPASTRSRGGSCGTCSSGFAPAAARSC